MRAASRSWETVAGAVHAIGANGKPRWKAHTGGAVYFPPAVSQGRVFAGSADGRVYAFEAATGRRLWSYRVAPAERWIPVFGKLISTWPVAGGVVVEDGVVYAAAGIAHYDTTHVVALDAITGKPKWYNGSSGTLEKTYSTTASACRGVCSSADGELRFVAGGVYETARYDLKTGRCLNEPKPGISSQFYTAFYPYYPAYGKYVSLEHTFADGRQLIFDASYEGNLFSQLALFGAPSAGSSEGEERSLALAVDQTPRPEAQGPLAGQNRPPLHRFRRRRRRPPHRRPRRLRVANRSWQPSARKTAPTSGSGNCPPWQSKAAQPSTAKAASSSPWKTAKSSVSQEPQSHKPRRSE